MSPLQLPLADVFSLIYAFAAIGAFVLVAWVVVWMRLFFNKRRKEDNEL